MKKLVIIVASLLILMANAFAQRPRHPDGPRPFPPPREGRPFPPGADMNGRGREGQRPGWMDEIDANKNQKIEPDEYQNAAEKFFKLLDQNQNGILEETEFPAPPEPGERRGKPMRGPDKPMKKGFPPFLFLNEGEISLSKRDFDEKIRQKFLQIDKDKSGAIEFEEIAPLRPSRPPGAPMGPQRPTAEFINAEMRFGDKWIKDAPFSADIIIENTRRLFDGTTVTNTSKGAIYRDTAGRTRREQILDSIGGFSVEPQSLIFINDFVAKTHYFIDLNRKSVKKFPIGDKRPEMPRPPALQGEKSESLGTKTIEGVRVEGTRIISEIPAGQIGNSNPLQVITEKWYSPDLQAVIMSKHTDPLSGEQVFRLANIKLGEPSSELFVPKVFK